MPWKIDETTKALAVDANSNPIWVQDGDGQEKAVDFEAITKALQNANNGEKDKREKLAALEKKYEALKDVENIGDYVKKHQELIDENKRLAENTDVSKIEEKVKEAREQLEKAWLDKERSWKAVEEGLKTEVATAQKINAEMKEKNNLEKIRNMFNESKYIKESCIIPESALCSMFSGMAKIDENGNFKGFDPTSPDQVLLGTDGNPVSFDAWLAKTIAAHPDSARILKGKENAGAGGNPSTTMPGKTNPFKEETRNKTQQMELWNSNPEEARRLALEAGIKVF
jgi:hypothetical protein